MPALKRLLKYLAREKGKITLGVLATMFLAAGETATGALLKIVTDSIKEISTFLSTNAGEIIELPLKIKIPETKIKILKVTLTGSDEVFRGMLLLCLAFIAIYILQALFDYAREVFMNAAAQRVLQSVKNDIYAKVLRLPAQFFDKNRTGDIVSRVTYDVTTLSQLIDLLIEVVRSGVYFIVLVPVLFWIDWKVAAFTVLFYPLSAVIIAEFSRRIKLVSKNLSDNVGDYTAFLEKKISSYRTVRSFVKEETEGASYQDLMEKNYRYNLKMILLKYVLKPSNELLGMFGVAMICAYFSYKLVYSDTTLGDAVFFLYIVKNAYKPFKKVAEAIGQLQLSLVCSAKIFTLLDEAQETDSAHEATKVDAVETIEFRDMSFAYNGGPKVFDRFSYKADKGSVVAVKGPSGCGKTTMLYLLLRLYDAKDGAILLNGTDIRNIPLAQLRKTIAIAGADIPLFPGTIRENLIYGNPAATDKDISQYLDFLGITADGLETVIGEGEILLSAGQKQKIGIARALLANPKVLLLDEVCASIDTESIERLFSLIKGVDIVFIVTRRRIIESRVSALLELG